MDVAIDDAPLGHRVVTVLHLHRTAASDATSGNAEVGRWAMLLFIVNEGTLFACLIASYFYLGLVNRAWPPAGVENPSLRLPLTMTILLLSSSAVLLIAEKGFERGQRVVYRACVIGTVALGAGFLTLQLVEYRNKLSHLRPSDNSYASLFYTITGLHGAHVAVGLLILVWAMAREMAGTVGAQSIAIKNASLYWHFVDAVWLVILASLYLSPHW
jgi:heme/copper-type cytochrome/quinol oxidase subunit 3